MTSPDWLAWSTAHGFSPIDAPGAEKTWSHSSGYGYVTLRFVWRRDDGKADVVVVASGVGINVGVCDRVGAEWLHAFFEAHSYTREISK